MSTTVGQFCLNVTDLERSIRFYEDLIGVPVRRRVTGDGFEEVILAAGEGGGRLQLAHHHDQTGPIEHGNALWKIYFDVDDVDDVHRRVVAAGYEAEGPPQRLEQWPVTIAFVFDPDGYRIELLQRHEA